VCRQCGSLFAHSDLHAREQQLSFAPLPAEAWVACKAACAYIAEGPLLFSFCLIKDCCCTAAFPLLSCVVSCSSAFHTLMQWSAQTCCEQCRQRRCWQQLTTYRYCMHTANQLAL
jgi:hypothetical protein